MRRGRRLSFSLPAAPGDPPPPPPPPRGSRFLFNVWQLKADLGEGGKDSGRPETEGGWRLKKDGGRRGKTPNSVE